MATATPRTRRSLLAAAAAGAAGLAAASLSRPRAVVAATGDPVLAGGNVSADAATKITATTGLSTDVVALNTVGAGLGSGVTGVSPSGAGVLGVSGDTSADAYGGNDVGVSGRAAGVDALAGVSGDSDVGFGVLGTSGGAGVFGAGAVIGVMANCFDVTGTSLYAVSSAGLPAAPAGNVAAHIKRAVTDPGHALFVDGRMRLKWSGRVAVAAGATSKKITVTGMTSGTMVFAMFQTNEAGVWVRAAIPTTNAITFAFSKALATSAVVAWMAVG
jgi:hypothetical protein